MATVYKGQIFPGYIAQIPGVDGPIRWKYRGMWPEIRAKYAKDLEMCANQDLQEALILKTMASMIVSWDLKYPESHPDKTKAGQPVPINADVIKNDVMVHVRNRIMAISTWQAFSDVDPQATVQETMKTVEAMVEGKTAAEMFDEVDAELVKN